MYYTLFFKKMYIFFVFCYNVFVNILKGVIQNMIFKEKFTKLSLNIFNYDFYVYKAIEDNNTWYEIIATKDNKDYFVCKLDYAKTSQGIRTFLLKDLAAELKQKYTSFNFKVLKNGIKVNDKVFRLKEQCFYYGLKLEITQYIVDLKEKNILVI